MYTLCICVCVSLCVSVLHCVLSTFSQPHGASPATPAPLGSPQLSGFQPRQGAGDGRGEEVLKSGLAQLQPSTRFLHESIQVKHP